MNTRRRRCCLILVLGFALLPFCAAHPDDAKPDAFRGQVVALDKLLAAQGVKLDADAAPAWVALKTEDGKLYPLVKDAGARMFFKDPSLRDRPMRLTGRLVPGTPFLQVVDVHSYRNGKLHAVYYWCDICTIKNHDPGICECCGMAVELREEPVREK